VKPGALAGRVLLVEDNPVNQEVTVTMLASIGIEVDVAENGSEALDALSKDRYDAVLMDCQMPGIDGYEATRLFRQREEERKRSGTPVSRTPIIALTAHAMKGDREFCLAAGMDDYLPKPFTTAGLKDILAKWIPAPAPPEGNGPAPGRPGAVLDPTVLDGLRELERAGSKGLVGRMARLFLDDAVKRIDTLTSAIDSEDAEGIWKTAHSLKSSSANIGASDLSRMFRELEMKGQAGTISDAGETLRSILEEFGAVRTALREETRGESPPDPVS
jgi:two-component system sensor histidine kinase/response regulator